MASATTSQNQLQEPTGFVDFVVRPVWDGFASLAPSITTITDNGPVAWRENLRLNYKHWKQVTDRNAAFTPTDHAVESEAKAESG